MDIVEINTTNIPEPTAASKAMNKLIEIILWPLGVLFLLVLFITLPLIDFVKHKILGRPKDALPVPQEKVLYKDSELTIIREDINYGVDKLAEDFLFSLVDYGDEMVVWKLKTNPELPALQDAFVTGLNLVIDDEIILQRIIEVNGQPSSELIGLNKKSKQVRVYQSIGLYDLYKFDAESNEILGVSRSENIRIKIK